jgi:phosphatidate cytidylyltransferase
MAMALSLNKSCYQYQLGQYCYCIICAFFASASAPTFAMLSCWGRFLYYFPQVATATNDGMAYFFGKAFGKHKLIALSPNKTWEGFFGGFIGNIFLTFAVSGWMLSSRDRLYWLCNDFKYEPAFFYNYECTEDSLNPMYKSAVYELPFSILGFNEIQFMPVQLWCVVFGLSASFIGPFAGFLASGTKRAYGIKDFAGTFPGHGGTVDRFDCQIYSCIFCGIIVTQFMFREEVIMDSITKNFFVTISSQ